MFAPMALTWALKLSAAFLIDLAAAATSPSGPLDSPVSRKLLKEFAALSNFCESDWNSETIALMSSDLSARAPENFSMFFTVAEIEAEFSSINQFDLVRNSEACAPTRRAVAARSSEGSA